MQTEYEVRVQKRHQNYIEYYEKVEPIKRYSLAELMEKNELELLALMPPNQCVDEYNEKFEWSNTKYIVGFKMAKTIDGFWNIGYYEGHKDKAQKDQFILFEITYVKNLKIGLIDLFLRIQNRSIERFENIKAGRMKIQLGDCWEDRVALKLDT